MSSSALVIIDPCIRKTGGHYATYAAACRQGFSELGVQTECWVHRDVDARMASTLAAHPVFTHDCWHQFNATPKLRFLVDPILAGHAFLRDARTARRRHGKELICFAPTVDFRQLLAWAWWLRRPDAPSRTVLMLRYSYASPNGTGWLRAAAWVRFAFRLLRGVPTARFRLTTDSDRLAAEYEALGATPVSVLPIPHTTSTGTRCADRTALPPGARVVMLGDARTEKGFAVLAEAIERLRAEGRVPETEFFIQANIESPVYAELRPARERLRALRGVTLLERALSDREYQSVLESADLVVLPYDRGVYRSRTSGPFSEALATGIPVVCTEDTWMSDQLVRFGAGETCVSGDPVALANAIERALLRLPELTALAERRRDAWVATHAPVNFARTLREVMA
jgi:glycosyltransferase involved in cell wall biosynthesis